MSTEAEKPPTDSNSTSSAEAVDSNAVLGLMDRARDHVGDLAAGTKRWRMCVPPEDNDSDMLLGDAIERGKEAVEMLEWIWANCRMIYYHDDGRYPIEHHPDLKPMRAEIEAESKPNQVFSSTD